jgi:hypothetical protein
VTIHCKAVEDGSISVSIQPFSGEKIHFSQKSSDPKELKRFAHSRYFIAVTRTLNTFTIIR